MEKDTVLLSVEEYNKLIQFKNELIDFQKETEEAIGKGKSYVIEHKWGEVGDFCGKRKYFTDNEIIEDFHKKNKSLIKENDELQKKIIDMRFNNLMEKATLKGNLANMSWREFKKWKVKQKLM